MSLELLCGMFVAARNLLTGSEPQSVLNCNFRKLMEDSCVMLPQNASKRKMDHHVIAGTPAILHQRGETAGLATSAHNPLDTGATTSDVLLPVMRTVALRPVTAGVTTVGRPCSNLFQSEAIR
jgi:hypothetical protein